MLNIQCKCAYEIAAVDLTGWSVAVYTFCVPEHEPVNLTGTKTQQYTLICIKQCVELECDPSCHSVKQNIVFERQDNNICRLRRYHGLNSLLMQVSTGRLGKNVAMLQIHVYITITVSSMLNQTVRRRIFWLWLVSLWNNYNLCICLCPSSLWQAQTYLLHCSHGEHITILQTTICEMDQADCRSAFQTLLQGESWFWAPAFDDTIHCWRSALGIMLAFWQPSILLLFRAVRSDSLANSSAAWPCIHTRKL